MTNWKTNLFGIGSIVSAVGSLLVMASKGQVDGPMMTAALSAISAGIGLLFAKDHNVTGTK